MKDFMRVLLLWRHNFEAAHRNGKAAFGDRYMLIRHEDLIFDTEATLFRIYDRMGEALEEAGYRAIPQQWRQPDVDDDVNCMSA